MGRREKDTDIGDPRYAQVDEVMRYGAGRLDPRQERLAEDVDEMYRRRELAKRFDQAGYFGAAD